MRTNRMLAIFSNTIAMAPPHSHKSKLQSASTNGKCIQLYRVVVVVVSVCITYGCKCMSAYARTAQ